VDDSPVPVALDADTPVVEVEASSGAADGLVFAAVPPAVSGCAA